MDLGDDLLAVVAVDQQPVGQRLDPVTEVGDLLRQRLVAAAFLGDPEPELGHLASGVLTDQVERAALGDDQPLVHHHQPVAELLGLIHVVGRDHQGHPGLLEPEQPVPEDVTGLGVQAGGGLVEEQQVGPVDQAPGDREPALHAAGEILDGRLRLLGELDELEQLVDAAVDLGPRDPEVAAVDEQVVADVELVVEGVLLRTDSQPAADRRTVDSRIHPEDLQLATTDRGHRRDHPHGRGLAGPIGPEEAERLAAPDLDVDALDRLEVTERLAQATGADHRIAHVEGP